MSSAAPKKVLIVEDDLLLSLLEEKLLHKMGYNVVGKVTSGEKAVMEFQKLKPDFIIMDIALSGKLDGIEATKKIREYAEIPVVFVSGNPDRFERSFSVKEGFTEFVSKPFTFKNLAEPISRIWPDN